MGDVRVPQSQMLVALRRSTPGMEVEQGNALVAYNVPAITIASTFGGISVAFRQAAVIEVQQAQVLVLVKGRVAYPTVRVWTFTLDSHDFYVVRLGDDETLVYDVKSEEWYNWSVAGKNILPVTTGINWLGGNKLADGYGSNVVVGDDTFGTLYMMSPETIFDESPTGDGALNQFQRIVQGQVLVRGYDSIPCFGVALYGDIGQADVEGALSVTLETSDNSGQSYQSRGTVSVVTGQFSQRVQWRSLGSMGAPGRLFRITDDGAFARLDGLEMQEAGQPQQQ